MSDGRSKQFREAERVNLFLDKLHSTMGGLESNSVLRRALDLYHKHESSLT